MAKNSNRIQQSPLESNGIELESTFHWNYNGIWQKWLLKAARFQPLPLDFIRFCWNVCGIINKNSWGSTQHDFIRILWNSNIPIRIQQNTLELMEECKDLQNHSVKNSSGQLTFNEVNLPVSSSAHQPWHAHMVRGLSVAGARSQLLVHFASLCPTQVYEIHN